VGALAQVSQAGADLVDVFDVHGVCKARVSRACIFALRCQARAKGVLTPSQNTKKKPLAPNRCLQLGQQKLNEIGL
jgi:hypothetical protein